MSLYQPESSLLPALEASGFVGTWETDLSTGIVYPSEPFAELLGLEARQAMAGVPLAAVMEGVHPADRERIGALVHQAHQTAGRFEAEFRTVDRAGVMRWVAARGRVQTDAQGRGLRCLGIAVNVTDTRRPTLESLEETSYVLNEIADNVLAARRWATALNSSLLRTLLDILLLELGRESVKTNGVEMRPH